MITLSKNYDNQFQLEVTNMSDIMLDFFKRYEPGGDKIIKKRGDWPEMEEAFRMCVDELISDIGRCTET